MSRSLRRRALAAALPAAFAAVALPAVAEAASVSGGQGAVTVLDRAFFVGGSIEDNDVVVRLEGSFLTVTDSAGVTTEHQGTGGVCSRVSAVQARCSAAGITGVTLHLGSGNDKAEYRTPHQGAVFLGVGSDIVVGGVREHGQGLAVKPVRYSGGPGVDMVTYATASRGVSLTPEDDVANDGPAGDLENVGQDFETFVGSNFRDAPLFGTPNADVMLGLGGDDALGAGGGNDLFITTPGDGADDYHGGPGIDTIDYATRSQPLAITLDNVANDGQSGERDQVRSNVENIIGGSAGDVLDSLGAFSRLEGRSGDDFLFGGSGPDTLIGGPGVDNLNAGGGNDVVDSRDGQLDTIDCGDRFDVDSLIKDGQERRVVDCETVQIGVLKLAPKTLHAKVDRPARVRLSWRHPRAWRKLRKIEVRLTRDGAPVGAITINPRRKRVAAAGMVALAARKSPMVARGKRVSVKLALRLDSALAGATLKAEVEATDVRGRRQLERRSATIRVAG